MLQVLKIVCIFASEISIWTITMNKYNITPRKENNAAYRSLVNPILMDELKEKILRIILLEKKYKEPHYSAKKLAQELGTNTRYISAVISVRFHTNYTSFINKFRIEEAMALMTDKRYKGLNMQDISAMVGFSNRQSFYSAFYKVNGITPLTYRKQQLKKTEEKKEK